LWANNQVTHELTLSLGVYPARFDAETEFIPILRNLVRKASQKVRGVPKRQLRSMTPHHPDAFFLAGFYEPTDLAGLLNPHWHGGVALRPGEERRFRECLETYFGADADAAMPALGHVGPPHSLVKVARAAPTFHLAKLTTPEHYIRYATKKSRDNEPNHWTTYDFIG
jgi:hypothetical protein